MGRNRRMAHTQSGFILGTENLPIDGRNLIDLPPRRERESATAALRAVASICEIRETVDGLVADIAISVDNEVLTRLAISIPVRVAAGSENAKFLWVNTLPRVQSEMGASIIRSDLI